MTRTLIATLAGRNRRYPASLATVTIDGLATNDIAKLDMTLDASDNRPVAFTLSRLSVINGKPLYVAEIHDITSMALTIEYQED